MLAMHILNVVLGLMLIGFAAVQYNDPDTWVWVTLYMVPAVWMYLVTFRPQSVSRSAYGMPLLWATLALYLAAVIFYWPQMPNFWRKEVWMAEETAREGMGVMIAFVVVLVAWLNTRLMPAGRAASRRAKIESLKA